MRFTQGSKSSHNGKMKTISLKHSTTLKSLGSPTEMKIDTSSHVANDNEKGAHKSKNPITTNSLFSMRAFNADRDLPIVYSEKYNMSLMGLELLHQFDTKKYVKIAEHLSDEFLDTPFARHRHHDEPHLVDEENPIRPRRLRYLAPNRPVSKQELGIHHTSDYIKKIHENKSLVARITETWMLNIIPLFVIEARLLIPIKWQIAGTIYATHLAMQHGWAINLGGGFHQGSAHDGETFCLFSDICLAMKYVWRKHPLQKFMIIDLDAHQATGLERDIISLEAKRRKMVYMMDVFNNSIQPPDSRADHGIDLRVELSRFTGDETYLHRLEDALKEAFAKFKPTLVIYVAGQDVLLNDQLGLMNLSDGALKKRDELIFSWATERQRCPIIMLLGGGYLARGAKIQADSIRNLFAKGLIWGGHRSGSRTLSRPRQSNKSVVDSIVSKSAGANRSGSKKTQVIKVAPVGSKFVTKKLPEEEEKDGKTK